MSLRPAAAAIWGRFRENVDCVVRENPETGNTSEPSGRGISAAPCEPSTDSLVDCNEWMPLVPSKCAVARRPGFCGCRCTLIVQRRRELNMIQCFMKQTKKMEMRTSPMFSTVRGFQQRALLSMPQETGLHTVCSRRDIRCLSHVQLRSGKRKV